MLRPIDVVRCFHNAFRRDISQIDTSVLKIAREGRDLTPIFDRLQIIGEILDYHARGEEAAVFPAVDNIAPLVAKAYIMDHRELDNMVHGLEAIRKAPDLLTTARATAVLNSHLRIHLDKEDVHLYPILRERTTDDRSLQDSAVQRFRPGGDYAEACEAEPGARAVHAVPLLRRCGIRQERADGGGRNLAGGAQDRPRGGGQRRVAARRAGGGEAAEVEPEYVPAGAGGDPAPDGDSQERPAVAAGEVRFGVIHRRDAGKTPGNCLTS